MVSVFAYWIDARGVFGVDLVVGRHDNLQSRQIQPHHPQRQAREHGGQGQEDHVQNNRYPGGEAGKWTIISRGTNAHTTFFGAASRWISGGFLQLAPPQQQGGGGSIRVLIMAGEEIRVAIGECECECKK
jgi:hypothetical protein